MSDCLPSQHASFFDWAAFTFAFLSRPVHTLHVPPCLAQCLHELQVVQALQLAPPVHVPADAVEANAVNTAHAKTMKLRFMTLPFWGQRLNKDDPILFFALSTLERKDRVNLRWFDPRLLKDELRLTCARSTFLLNFSIQGGGDIAGYIRNRSGRRHSRRNSVGSLCFVVPERPVAEIPEKRDENYDQ